MPQEFRYPLTRYCLRGGALTLPRAMVGLFPESGEVTAVDTRTETEHTLTVVDPRTVTGLGPIFRQHRLAANDELIIRPLEDRRFSITALSRDQQPDYSSSEAIENVLDELITASVPVTEAEVRALYPGIPASVPLGELFAADQRFVRREGRWHNALSVAYPLEPSPAGAVVEDSSAVATGQDPDTGAEHDGRAYAAVGSGPAVVAAAAAQGSAPVREGGARGSDGGAEREAVDPGDAGGEGDDGGLESLYAAPPTPNEGTAHQSAHHVQAGLWQHDAGGRGPAGDAGEARQPGSGRTSGTVLERRQPMAATANGRADGGARVAPREQEVGDSADGEAGPRAGASVDLDGAGGADEDPGASLEVTELSNRLRAMLAGVGFRIEPVARGQLLLTADMGRKSYTVLAQLLTRSDRLDWADLLARRRSLNVRYLAVFGDHRALLRLVNPAELARATMWSWQALDRLATLARTVSFSPIELESHFERDGLFEKGLERFEAAVAKRVAERGAMSELLTRLAVMRAPTVFMLEDLVGELKVPRDRLLRQLELLCEAPFHLLARVDAGEFVLRQRVADSLTGLASYATSLRERLPSKQVERLTGLAEPDLLTEDELEAQLTQGLSSGSAT